MTNVAPLFEAMLDDFATQAIQAVEADPQAHLLSEQLRMQRVARTTAELCFRNLPITEQGEI